MSTIQMLDEPGTSARTFIFDGEGHSLGNALRAVLIGNPNVKFCAYTVPHPAALTMHFRIQVCKGDALDALKKGLEDLVAFCDTVTEKFDEELEDFKR